MEITLIVIFGLLGIAIGSFLNVCSDRLPAGKSLISPPSHCDACQRRIPKRDLIPIVSYLWLRGRCRYCGASIPCRVLWLEIGSGLLLAFLFWRYGLTAEFAVTAFYGYVFVLIGVIDLEHKLILNKIVYPALIVAIIINLLITYLKFMPEPGLVNGLIGAGLPFFVKGFVGAGAGFVFLLIPALLFKDGLGWGDVKMAALIGMVAGFPAVFLALFSGIILGGLVAVFLLVFKVKKRKDAIPFGPFLTLGTLVTLFFGAEILNQYFSLF